MKKTLVIGLALAFGLSACEFIPMDSSTNPLGGWSYVQAKKVDTVLYTPAGSMKVVPGKALCNLLENFGGIGIADEGQVDNYLTDEEIQLDSLGHSARVWLESTLPLLSIDTLQHSMQIIDTDGVVKCTVDVTLYRQYNNSLGVYCYYDNPNPLEANIEILFDAEWDLLQDETTKNPAVQMAPYSRLLTITRLVNELEIDGEKVEDPGVSAVLFTFHARGYIKGDTCFGPKYTGFKVRFPLPVIEEEAD